MFDDVRIAIARRDLESLSREKTIVLALLIQLFIAAFSSFLVVGLTSMYDPGSVDSDQLTVAISGDAAQELDRAARESEVNTQVYPSQEAALEAFQRNRQISAVLHGDYTQRTITVTATVPSGSIRSTVTVVKVRETLETLERTERVKRQGSLSNQPVQLPPEADASPYFGFTYTILVPLLLFLPPFISGSVTVDSITEEIERGTLELLRVAPVTLTDIVDGKALGMALLAPAQAILWIGLMSVNGIAIQNVLPILVLVSSIALVVVVLGAVLGLTLGVRRSAQLLYSIIALGLFGAAALLPEHPATVAAKLAVGSETPTTMATVVGLAIVSVVLYAGTRRYAATIDPERYS